MSRRGFRIGCAPAFLFCLLALIGSVISYRTIQRGPLHALDCWVTDDFAVNHVTEAMTLGDFRESVRDETRNCARLRVVDGPTEADAIVVSPVGRRVLYRGQYTIDVRTIPAQK